MIRERPERKSRPPGNPFNLIDLSCHLTQLLIKVDNQLQNLLSVGTHNRAHNFTKKAEELFRWAVCEIKSLV